MSRGWLVTLERLALGAGGAGDRTAEVQCSGIAAALNRDDAPGPANPHILQGCRRRREPPSPRRSADRRRAETPARRASGGAAHGPSGVTRDAGKPRQTKRLCLQKIRFPGIPRTGVAFASRADFSSRWYDGARPCGGAFPGRW